MHAQEHTQLHTDTQLHTQSDTHSLTHSHIYILIFEIEQESIKIFSSFPCQVKNQEF